MSEDGAPGVAELAESPPQEGAEGAEGAVAVADGPVVPRAGAAQPSAASVNAADADGADGADGAADGADGADAAGDGVGGGGGSADDNNAVEKQETIESVIFGGGPQALERRKLHLEGGNSVASSPVQSPVDEQNPARLSRRHWQAPDEAAQPAADAAPKAPSTLADLLGGDLECAVYGDLDDGEAGGDAGNGAEDGAGTGAAAAAAAADAVPSDLAGELVVPPELAGEGDAPAFPAAGLTALSPVSPLERTRAADLADAAADPAAETAVDAATASGAGGAPREAAPEVAPEAAPEAAAEEAGAADTTPTDDGRQDADGEEAAPLPNEPVSFVCSVVEPANKAALPALYSEQERVSVTSVSGIRERHPTTARVSVPHYQ